MRRAQECVELCLMGTLRLAGIEYPRSHEVSQLLADVVTKKDLPDWFKRRLDQISAVSRRLAEKRPLVVWG